MLPAAALTALLWLPVPASADDGAHGRTATEATFNIDNPDPWTPQRVRADLRRALRAASLIRVQEAYPRTRAVIRAFIARRPNWRISPGPLELLTIYNTRIWAPTGPPKSREFPSSGRWGARYLEWRRYRHIPTGAVVRVANGHADPGCSRSTARYARALARWTAQRNPGRPTLFGGDLNCTAPPRALYGPYRRDHGARLDHLLTTRGGPATRLTWIVPMASDHPMRVRRIRLP